MNCDFTIRGLMMDDQEKEEILSAAQKFFRERLAENHLKNTEKLVTVEKFNVNPFTWRYLAKFAFGDISPESLAKALIYPRVLGTSIATSFGTMLQYFSVDVLKGYASTTQGIDIEFDDAVDGRHKYCQLKAGPNTINKDDVKTIEDHFKAVKALARTNGLHVAMDDCIVGVLYGERKQLSTHYKNIDEDYPVLVGQVFWEHLTGDKNFYYELIDAFASVADEIDSSQAMRRTIRELAYDIKVREMKKAEGD